MNQVLAGEILFFERDTPLRLLLAVDDTNLRRLVAIALRRDGHQVVEARDAADFLEALASTVIEPVEAAIDLVICEHALPGIPGLTLLAGLRARRLATPFILLTNHAIVRDRARQLNAVVTDRRDLAGIRAVVRRASQIRPAND